MADARTTKGGRGTVPDTAPAMPRIDLGELIEVAHAAVLRAEQARIRPTAGRPIRGPITVGIIYWPEDLQLRAGTTIPGAGAAGGGRG